MNISFDTDQSEETEKQQDDAQARRDRTSNPSLLRTARNVYSFSFTNFLASEQQAKPAIWLASAIDGRFTKTR